MGELKKYPGYRPAAPALLMLIFLLASLRAAPLPPEKPVVPGLSHAPATKDQGRDTLRIIRKNPEKMLRNIDFRERSDPGFNFWEEEFSGHWAGIDFGLNTFLHTDYSGYDNAFLKNNLIRSNSLFINPFQHSFGLNRNKNTFGVVTGLGLWLESFRLEKNTTLEKRADGTIVPKILVFDDNQKSKFSLAYLTVPLLAELQIPMGHDKNRLFLSAGVVGGYRLDSHTKIKYRLERKKEKLKTPGDFSLPDFRYSLMIRAGYRSFQFFALSDLRPLFQKEAGPEVTPFTFGITLISF